MPNASTGGIWTAFRIPTPIPILIRVLCRCKYVSRGTDVSRASTLRQLAWHIPGRRMIRRVLRTWQRSSMPLNGIWCRLVGRRCLQRLRSVIATKWKPTSPKCLAWASLKSVLWWRSKLVRKESQRKFLEYRSNMQGDMEWHIRCWSYLTLCPPVQPLAATATLPRTTWRTTMSHRSWCQHEEIQGTTPGTLAICLGGVRKFAWQQFPRNWCHTIFERFKKFKIKTI